MLLAENITTLTDRHYSLDSEDDFRSGCRNVSHQQQFFSELHSPGRSHNTNYWYSWVQTIYYAVLLSPLCWFILCDSHREAVLNVAENLGLKLTNQTKTKIPEWCATLHNFVIFQVVFCNLINLFWALFSIYDLVAWFIVLTGTTIYKQWHKIEDLQGSQSSPENRRHNKLLVMWNHICYFSYI